MSATNPVPGVSLAPNGAIGTGLAAGAAVGVLVWLVKVTLHIDVPDYVQNDLIILGSAAGTWLHPAGRVPKA